MSRRCATLNYLRLPAKASLGCGEGYWSPRPWDLGLWLPLVGATDLLCAAGVEPGNTTTLWLCKSSHRGTVNHEVLRAEGTQALLSPEPEQVHAAGNPDLQIFTRQYSKPCVFSVWARSTADIMMSVTSVINRLYKPTMNHTLFPIVFRAASQFIFHLSINVRIIYTTDVVFFK